MNLLKKNALRIILGFSYLALTILLGVGLLTLVPFIKGYVIPYVGGNMWSLGLILAVIIFWLLGLYVEKIILKRK